MRVYLITNLINGKQYVGQTRKTLQQRFIRHCERGAKICMPIVWAIRKYGKENFTIEEICQCQTQQELDTMETLYAILYETFSPNGYNLKAGNGPGCMSEETKKKIGDRSRGRKASTETRRLLSESHKGIRLSQEAKKKLSDFNKGKKSSLLTRQRLSESCQKTYRLYNPSGELVEITNMRQFCIAHGLRITKMCEVVRGKKLHHRGWTLDPNLFQLAMEQQKHCKIDRYFFVKKGYFHPLSVVESLPAAS